MGIAKRLSAECLGSASLVAISAGCGFAATSLAAGDPVLALLFQAVVTSAGLAALILSLGPVSGGLFNPLLTLAQAWRGKLPLEHAAPYIAAQLAGALIGSAAAHSIAGAPWLVASAVERSGPAIWQGEFVAAFGLLAVFIGCHRSRPQLAPFAVAVYVLATCWHSSATAFFNPAMTLARVFGAGPGGIRLADAPLLILAQLAGAATATAFTMLLPTRVFRRAG